MTAYAIARIRDADPTHPEIAEYLGRIASTLEPFSGRFLIHGGGRVEEMEGSWDGIGVIVIEFPDRASAQGWYSSDAYQAILPLRTRNSTMDTILVDGVPENYDPTWLINPPAR